MDINWLIDFVCLGRTLNFSRAAEERNVTQSAFSRRIKSLESWVGTSLIDRSSYPVQLTPAGRQFLGTAQVTLAQLTDARQTIRAAEHSKLPQQRIAALHAISVNYLQPRLSEFAKQIPEDARAGRVGHNGRLLPAADGWGLRVPALLPAPACGADPRRERASPARTSANEDLESPSPSRTQPCATAGRWAVPARGRCPT